MGVVGQRGGKLDRKGNVIWLQETLLEQLLPGNNTNTEY